MNITKYYTVTYTCGTREVYRIGFSFIKVITVIYFNPAWKPILDSNVKFQLNSTYVMAVLNNSHLNVLHILRHKPNNITGRNRII